MLTPEGQSGDNTDKVMLLAMWAQTLRNEAIDSPLKPMISAGMGKPTYPINKHTVAMYLAYWQAIEALLIQAQSLSEKDMASAALDYGDGRGDLSSREIMANAMTRWYGASVHAENILFTVGGAGALRVIFETLNEMNQNIPRYRVITPFPHYSLYADNRHQLHPIDVMKEPGYQLTAAALEKSIKQAMVLAEQDNNHPKVLLLCNPSNPLGTIIPESEWIKMAAVLRQYPDLTIVMDEAYAEMCWDCEKAPSLLTIAPDLKERTIIMRSATKALSAAGERMAMLMAFDPTLMAKLRNKNISTIGHAPCSAQLAYAETMNKFSPEEKISLKNYYKPKVDYIYNQLQSIGAGMPDALYKVEGTFYVLGDFSDLFGMALPMEASRALGKTGVVTTSEELAYYLLFKESLMIAPGAYFGMPPESGFMRITCSGTREELQHLMERLEQCLLQARQIKTDKLREEINNELSILSPLDANSHQLIQRKIALIIDHRGDCLALKHQNQELMQLLSEIRVLVKRATPEGQISAAKTIYTFYSHAVKERKKIKIADDLKTQWKNYINDTVSEDGALKNYLLNLSDTQKATYKPWVEHLQSLQKQADVNFPKT